MASAPKASPRFLAFGVPDEAGSAGTALIAAFVTASAGSLTAGLGVRARLAVLCFGIGVLRSAATVPITPPSEIATTVVARGKAPTLPRETQRREERDSRAATPFDLG
jgi:hypothetical protein